MSRADIIMAIFSELAYLTGGILYPRADCQVPDGSR